MALGKLQAGDTSFFFGGDSMLDPVQLPPGFYARGMNIVNRGGITQCRPGYRCRYVLPEGNQQGGAIFTPKSGVPQLIFAVSGQLYISPAPFREFTELNGATFSETARELYFKQVEQSIRANDNGSLTLIQPRNLLIIQDGGSSPAGVFDGTTLTTNTGIPAGGPSEWVGDRLWQSQGSALYASDIGNPISFTEPLYFVTPLTFTLPGPITAMTKTPGMTSPQLLVFTERSTTLFQAGIRNRSAWLSTPDFQKDDLFPGIGAVSNRGVAIHNGFLWWYAAHGITSLDAASQSNISSTLTYEDAEMQDSKGRLSDDLSGVAFASFENYLLASVPHADLRNTHTWVLDTGPMKRGAPSAWNGYWTGTRPIQWLTTEVDGVSRCFHISLDYDGHARLWEAFTPDRLDDGCPITWWVEFRGLDFDHPMKLKEFRYADFFLSELSGVVDVAVYWAGSHRGRYKKVLTKRIQASAGMLETGHEISMSDILFDLKKQSRPLRTQDGRTLASEETLSSCGVESPNVEFKDVSFQLLIVGSGPGAVRAYIAYAEPPKNEDDSGGVERDETEENFVRFDGAAAEGHTIEEAHAQFEEEPTEFSSVRTVTLSQNGFTAIGTGRASSIISQENADYVAQRIATRKAAHELEEAQPEIISIGAAANEL